MMLVDLWKESLNCDGQPFHQYQRTNNITPPIIEQHIAIGSSDPGFGQAQKCGSVKLFSF
jgi:hypothetical protein